MAEVGEEGGRAVRAVAVGPGTMAAGRRPLIAAEEAGAAEAVGAAGTFEGRTLLTRLRSSSQCSLGSSHAWDVAFLRVVHTALQTLGPTASSPQEQGWAESKLPGLQRAY